MMKKLRELHKKIAAPPVDLLKKTQLIDTVRQFLDLDIAIRGHLHRAPDARKTPEGATAWFDVLEEMRKVEALLKEKMRSLL
jgi:hypothetical protein